MKVRKRSITTKFFLIMTLLLLISNGVLGIIIYNRTSNMMLTDIKENAMQLAKCAAANVDAKTLMRIDAGDEFTDEYQAVIEDLDLIRENSNAEYVYTLRMNEFDEVEFAVDSDPEEPGAIGEAYEATDSIMEAFEGQVSVDAEPTSDKWGTFLSANAPIFYNDQVVAIASIDLDANWVSEQVAGVRNVIIIVCVITFVLSMIILSILSKNLKKSFAVLNNKILDIADGSGDLTKEILMTSGDEFETIANNINRFSQEIRNLVSNVSKTSDHIISYGETLNDNIIKNNQIVLNIDSEIATISANMQESSASSELTSSRLAETEGKMVDFANNVHEIQNIATEANQSAIKAYATAQEHMVRAKEEIERLQGRMHTISEEAKKIQQVREIAEHINNIADQTRMLSLNAQIEAARAGAHGAGFAIVATEVGSLSNEIEEAVTTINHISAEAVSAVEKLLANSNEMTRFISEEVIQDYNSFAELGDEYGNATRDIKERVTDIMNETDEISGIISGINDNIAQINKTVAESASSASELAHSSNIISDSMQELTSLAQENTSQSNNLNEQIQKYIF